jgi:hypothetical protein
MEMITAGVGIAAKVLKDTFTSRNNDEGKNRQGETSQEIFKMPIAQDVKSGKGLERVIASAPQQVTAQIAPSPVGEGGRRVGNLLAQAPAVIAA